MLCAYRFCQALHYSKQNVLHNMVPNTLKKVKVISPYNRPRLIIIIIIIIIILRSGYYAGDKIEKNELGWACGAYG